MMNFFSSLTLVLVVVIFGDRMIAVETKLQVQKILRQFSKSEKGIYTLSEGKTTNCGPPTSNLIGTWSPEPVIIDESVTIEVNMTAVSYVNNINGNVEVWEGKKWQEETPFINTTFKFDCGYVKTQFYTPLKCPVKKGDSIFVKYTMAERILPEGTYSFRIKLRNEEDVEFLCAIAILTFRQSFRKNITHTIF